MSSVIHIWAGDLLKLPSGRIGRLVRWRVQVNQENPRASERVADVRLSSGEVLTLSERHMGRAEKMREG